MSEKKYSKDYFSLVQDDERLHDKPLKTKQLTYFQDAMLRFTKNKYNLIATFILSFLIFLSIVVPMLTPKALYTETNSAIKTLPPRIPFLSDFGIFDGTKDYENQPVDLSTIDPVTGIGLPIGFLPEFIYMSTLKNSDVHGSDRSPLFVGGTNDLYINSNRIGYSIQSPTVIEIVDGTTLEVDINYLDARGIVEVYFLDVTTSQFLTSWDQVTLLTTITEAGTYDINILENVTAGSFGKLVIKYALAQTSTNGSERVSFNSISILYPNSDNNIVYSGYTLSEFSLVVVNNTIENGRFLRKDAIMKVSSFTYDKYSAILADVPKTIGGVEYRKILEDNPGMEDTIVFNPDDSNSWTFASGYPLSGVISSDTIVVGGIEYGNYRVMMSGTYATGFETAPFFFFGTDSFGRDLFSLIWLGLRTSLLLGLVASLTNIIVGVIWGAISAYYGGQVDILMERFTDIWGSFPQITMIGIITVLIGPGFAALFIFMVYDGWIRVAKVTRLQFYRYKGREYVLAARTLGASDRRIIFRHILPNALGTIVTRVILSIPSVIFLEVALSYLGFGIGNGQSLDFGPISLTGTSIGVILNDGQQQIFAGNLWLIIYPTIVVSILMITFNMFGNALRDALNPQLRGGK